MGPAVRIARATSMGKSETGGLATTESRPKGAAGRGHTVLAGANLGHQR